MKVFFSIIAIFLIFNITFADDCGVHVLEKAIELYRDFQALRVRGCQDLKISVDTYSVIKKKCIQDLAASFNLISYEKVYELTLDFLSTDCFRKSAIETCDDIEYKKLRHCAVDFWVDHLEEGLQFYRNETIRYGAYSYLIEAKGCLQKSLDQIESAHKLKSIQV